MLAHRTLAMPSRTLVGPAGVKASTHLSSFAPGPPPGRPWASCRWLMAAGLLGTENWGPLAHRACPTNQPASVPRGHVLFRMIDDFVRVLRWASICFVGPVHQLSVLPVTLPAHQLRLPHALSLVFVHSLCPALPNHDLFFFFFLGYVRIASRVIPLLYSP